MGYKKSKTYKPESTDLALTPPQREWNEEQLNNRLRGHQESVEKATADARQSTIPSDNTSNLAAFGFNSPEGPAWGPGKSLSNDKPSAGDTGTVRPVGVLLKENRQK